MKSNPFDAIVRAGVVGATRRQTLAAVAALALGAPRPVPAAGRRCDRCDTTRDCPGRATCAGRGGKKSCCRGYWWRNACYRDKQVKKQGWRFHVSNGQLTYCQPATGVERPAKQICHA